ncbi:TPA: O-antigen polymerase [Photobacterium damselae]
MKSISFNNNIFWPIIIFSSCWILGIFFSWIKVSYYSFTNLSFSIPFFIYNLFFFLFPFFCYFCLRRGVRLKYDITIFYSKSYVENFIKYSSILLLLLILFNIYKHGYPPFFSIFGFTTKNYVEYGSLKQVIFSLTTVIMLACVLSSNYIKIFLFGFVFILFMSRGPLLTSLSSVLLLLLMINKLKLKSIFIVFIILMIGNAWLGDLRTNKELFLQYMNILPDKSDWNTSFLWFISYVSTPFSNMLWITENELNVSWGESLVTFLPGSLRDEFFPSTLHYPSYIIDGVHGYITPIFNDYGFIGVAIFNMILGTLFCYFHSSHKFLIYTFFLGMLSFIFFFNPFIQLTTIISLFFIFYLNYGVKKITYDV